MTVLCRLDEIPEPGGKGFTFGEGKTREEIFVLRKDGKIYGYVNRCPHAGVPLDWTPDRFLDHTNTLIMCATHGALFGIEDGLCVAGPCKGRSLVPIKIRIVSIGPESRVIVRVPDKA